MVDGDKHQKLVESGQMDSPLYREMIDPLVAMHRRVPEIAYMYSFVVRGEKLHYVLDTATQAKRLGFRRKMDASDLMQPFKSDSPTEEAREIAAVKKWEFLCGVVSRAGCGWLLHYGLAPIYDSAGKPVAALGVNLDVTLLYQRLARNRFAMWSGLGAAAVAAILIGMLVWSIRLKALRAERERAGAQAARRVAEVEQALLIEALGEVVYHFDLEKDVIAYSGRCEVLLGLKPSEINRNTQDWLDAVHPDDRERVWKTLEEAKTGREIFSAEYRILRADGEYVWVSDRAVFTFDGNEKPTAMDGVMLNISQRRISDERFRVIFEASTEPHMLVNAEGVLDCNHATVEMLGYRDKSEIIRQPLTKFWPELQADGRTTAEHALGTPEATIAKGVDRREVLNAPPRAS